MQNVIAQRLIKDLQDNLLKQHKDVWNTEASKDAIKKTLEDCLDKMQTRSISFCSIIDNVKLRDTKRGPVVDLYEKDKLIDTVKYRSRRIARAKMRSHIDSFIVTIDPVPVRYIRATYKITDSEGT